MKDLKKIGKRLQQFMSVKNIGVNELGRLTETSGAQISNIINGKKYGVDKLLNILIKFPELNIYWLLNGQGEMLLQNNAGPATIDLDGLLKENEDLKSKSEKLFIDLQTSNVANEKLTDAVDYQNLTIEAYKKTIETQTASINDLKEMVELLKNNSKYNQNKTA